MGKGISMIFEMCAVIAWNRNFMSLSFTFYNLTYDLILEITDIQQDAVLFPQRGGGIQAFIWQGCSPKIKCQISQEKELLKIQTPQKLGNRKFIVFKKWFFRIRFLTHFGGLIIKLMLLFKYRN